MTGSNFPPISKTAVVTSTKLPIVPLPLELKLSNIAEISSSEIEFWQKYLRLIQRKDNVTLANKFTEWIRLIINRLKLSLVYPIIWSNQGNRIKMVLEKYLQKTCVHPELMQLNEYLHRTPDHKPINFWNYKWFTLNNPLINICNFSVIPFCTFLFPIHMEEVMLCRRCENNSNVIKVHILQANITSSEFK